jgi:hypothetical protein
MNKLIKLFALVSTLSCASIIALAQNAPAPPTIADPEWQKARAESEKNGRLAEKVESVILMATDYSPIK